MRHPGLPRASRHPAPAPAVPAVVAAEAAQRMLGFRSAPAGSHPQRRRQETAPRGLAEWSACPPGHVSAAVNGGGPGAVCAPGTPRPLAPGRLCRRCVWSRSTSPGRPPPSFPDDGSLLRGDASPRFCSRPLLLPQSCPPGGAQHAHPLPSVELPRITSSTPLEVGFAVAWSMSVGPCVRGLARSPRFSERIPEAGVAVQARAELREPRPRAQPEVEPE